MNRVQTRLPSVGSVSAAPSRTGRAAAGQTLTRMAQAAQTSPVVRQLARLRDMAAARPILQREEDPVTVTRYETGFLTQGPRFEHIHFSDGSYWSTKIATSNQRHVYLDIRAGLHKGEGYSVPDQYGYKAQEVKSWLLGLHPDLAGHWQAYRAAAT